MGRPVGETDRTDVAEGQEGVVECLHPLQGEAVQFLLHVIVVRVPVQVVHLEGVGLLVVQGAERVVGVFRCG